MREEYNDILLFLLQIFSLKVSLSIDKEILRICPIKLKWLSFLRKQESLNPNKFSVPTSITLDTENLFQLTSLVRMTIKDGRKNIRF